MGLPTIDITFSTLAATAIQRSLRGIVALILRDDTNSTAVHTFYSVADITTEDWTAANLQYIKDAFLGTPRKVIVINGATSDVDYSTELATLASEKWNWLAVPGIDSTDAATLASWIESQRAAKKTFKAVLPNQAADSEGIINFSTEDIVVGENTYSASQYTARIAGILAGLSLDRSGTYFELSEVEGITESSDPDGDIDAGKLILIKDGDSFKIGRAVTSLTTLTTSKAEQFQKIKIVEGMDLIKEDIRTTFKDEYVGKVVNSYDNQVLFLTAVNAYIRGLEGTVLDPNYENAMNIDVEAMREAWNGAGTDTSEMTDKEVKEMAFSSNVYLAGNVKALDAMEDCAMGIALA